MLPAGAQLGAADPRRADPRPRPRVGASHRTSVSHFTQFSFQMSFKQHLQKKRRPRRRLTDKPPSSPHLLAGIIDFFCGRLVYIRRAPKRKKRSSFLPSSTFTAQLSSHHPVHLQRRPSPPSPIPASNDTDFRLSELRRRWKERKKRERAPKNGEEREGGEVGRIGEKAPAE